LLAKVHIAKNEVGLSDADYQICLLTLFDRVSAKDLSDVQLDRLLKHFESVGWLPKDKDGRPVSYRNKRGTPEYEPGVDAERQPSMKKIKALLTQIGKMEGRSVPWEYANAILRRQCEARYLNWATLDELGNVIAALNKRVAQLKKKEQAAAGAGA
jgi:hypothetical protein